MTLFDELLKWAEDGNADQLFAVIDENCDHGAEREIANRYESAEIDDSEFCNLIVTLIKTGGNNNE